MLLRPLYDVLRMISICADCTREEKGLGGNQAFIFGLEGFRFRLHIAYGCDFVFGGVSCFVVLSSLATCKTYITDRLPLF